MNILHLHLLLNHLPVIGTILVGLLLVGAVRRESLELTRASLGLLALLGAAAVVVYLTGEPAEEIVEKLPGVSRDVIERHEDLALVATMVLGVTGALSLLALAAFRRRTPPRWIAPWALVATVVAGGLMGFTANLGGQIRHTEIRAGTATAGAQPDSTEPDTEHLDR